MKHILALAFLMIATGSAAFAQCSDADKKALEAFDRAWAAAGLSGDKAALTAIYADDYHGLPDMLGKTATIDNTMATFERNKANPPTSTTTYDHYLMACTPTTATVTHRNSTVSSSGSTTYSRSVHILEKRNGKWQAVSNAANNLDDGGAIWYLEQDWNNAVMKREKTWFDKHFASDYTGVNSTTGSITRKAAEIADIVGDKGLELAETTDISIRVDGDRAVATGIFRTKGKDDKGVAYDRRVRYIDTWVKRDGRWQAWTSQGTRIP
jgi:ketosteroid isomerase-like protein